MRTGQSLPDTTTFEHKSQSRHHLLTSLRCIRLRQAIFFKPTNTGKIKLSQYIHITIVLFYAHQTRFELATSRVTGGCSNR